MPTNKFVFKRGLFGVVLGCLALGLWGCAPAGPQALLEGRQLLQQGQYAPAAEKLKLAVTLLRTNAEAWNDLGLAYHHSGQPAAALAAYQAALKYNPDLVVVHFNLGCLHLEQNRLEPARNELTAFTVHEAKATEGWLKLGDAQLRLGDLVAAEAAFRQVLNQDLQNLEALNNLGVIQFRRGRPRDALVWFNLALKKQADYGPTLLNLAVMYQAQPTTRAYALKKYQEYLALEPRPGNWESISNAARQLELELNPPPIVRPPTNNPALLVRTPTNSPPLNGSNAPGATIRPVAPETRGAPTNPVVAAIAVTNRTPSIQTNSIATNPPAIAPGSVPLVSNNARPTNELKPTVIVPSVPAVLTNGPKPATSNTLSGTRISAPKSKPPVTNSPAAVAPPVTTPAVKPPPTNPVTITHPLIETPRPTATNTAIVATTVVSNPPLAALVAPPAAIPEPVVPRPLPVTTPPPGRVESNAPSSVAVNPPLLDPPITLPQVEVPAFLTAEPAPPAPLATPVPVVVAPPAAPPAGKAAATETGGAKPAKKGFFGQLNPMNLFTRQPTPPPAPTPLPPLQLGPESPVKLPANNVAVTQLPAVEPARPATETAPPVVTKAPAPARYAYTESRRPAAGNHTEATRLLDAARAAQSAGKNREALAGFRQAAQTDPAFFDAQSALGLAALEAGDLPAALLAYERALAISPAAFGARVNFGLALKKAQYPIDAAMEWERVLVLNPEESPARLAAVHLLLATIYAEQFHQPASARSHFQRVLDLDPHNSQADAIRYWLADHP